MTIRFLEIAAPPNSVEAAYNPNKITVEKSVSWAEHKGKGSDGPVLEFTSGGRRSINVELFFDTFESREDVHAKHIALLEKGTVAMGTGRSDKDRPPTCLILWGPNFPRFYAVIESLSVSYTMFFPNGTPCRATAQIKLQEVPRRNRDAALKAFKPRTQADREHAEKEHNRRRTARRGR